MIKIRIAPTKLHEKVDGLAGTRIYVQKDEEPEVDISGLVRTVSWEHRAGDLPVYKLELISDGDPGYIVEVQDLMAHTDESAMWITRRTPRPHAADESRLEDITRMFEQHRHKRKVPVS